MPGVEIQAILCPYEAYKDHDPLPSWPHVPGVTVRLTKKPGAPGKAGDGPHEFEKTDDDGVSNTVDVAAATYVVTVSDAPKLWTCATKDIPVTPETAPAPAGGPALPKRYTVILIPDDGRQLVPWNLTYDDPATGTDVLAKFPIQIEARDGFAETFISDDKGRINAVAPLGNATAKFGDADGKGTKLLPEKEELTFPVNQAINPGSRPMQYAPEILFSVRPRVKPLAGKENSLAGAEVTLTSDGRQLDAKTLGKGVEEVTFGPLAKGTYAIAIDPHAEGLTLVEPPPLSIDLRPGDRATVTAVFKQEQNVSGRVQTEDGKPVTQDVQLQISDAAGAAKKLTAVGGTFDTFVALTGALTIGVVPGQKLEITGVPLVPPAGEQPLLLPPKQTVVSLPYAHAIKGRALNERGELVPDAEIDIFSAEQRRIATIEAGPDGRYTYGVAKPGNYFVAQHPEDEEVIVREPVEVHSNGNRDVRIRTGLARGEAVTDLSSYPVLTEEISTAGPPAPAYGGPGAAGADYGPVVDRVMRDVLGWRPGPDVAGFQAALTGAFQLREVEGHTAWSWQQRGYAVQADMGALTGAQASIYARAKGALDQILPLLSGITTLDPALFPPQDLEAIRSVIAAELNELVNELGLEGGPRIERVDELFSLLLGQGLGPVNMDPDAVQGQLGTMRDRFGLTVAYVDTVDEERIVTNFRIVVEQVLALQASWNSIDRTLLSTVNENSSLGTVLIWLSRGLEAVCESVNDLTFTMDSVFVDAAQRQVIELKFGGQPILLLSDLLDWVTRACRDEGPRMIQDSGKDGVTAFAPVLRKLLDLVRRTRDVTRPGVPLPAGMRPVPDGLRTPRVGRAFQVLVSQLSEARRLAELVQRDGVPQITDISQVAAGGIAGELVVTLNGVNFRGPASAILFALNREEIPDVPSRHVKTPTPSKATAKFRIPKREFDDRSLSWQVVLTNEDGTTSAPADIDVHPLS
jgi:hypothetical protein